VLSARDVVVPGRLDLAAAGVRELRVAAGARLLITGANGAGKSTLLGVLAGDLEPASGTVTRAPGTDLALLEQDVYLPGERRTPRQLLALMAGLDADSDAVDPAGLVHARDLDRPVGELSVGQRRRVILAMLVTHTPDVLLLDEPTNHISLTLAEELMAALRDWPGAVVVASHDRWLRKTWTGQSVHLGGRS
jgi:macrolide transport system ATP-binding/permease protein